MSEEDGPQLSKRKIRKNKFRETLERLLDSYRNILVIGIDNVGSNQMQQVRIALRGKAELLMGKNTIIRKVVRERAEKDVKLEGLLPFIRGNVGFCFTNSDLTEIRNVIVKNKVPAAAKTGALAPDDVRIPAGPSGLDPGQTNFFQALNIATKIARGSIEIINEVHLVKKGEKVTASAVALLTKLNIKPFFYGLQVTTVYEDGSVYDAKVLDWSAADLLQKFFNGVRHVAALSLKLGYPTEASLPHIIANGFKNLVAISLVTDIDFDQAKKYKDWLANPGAFAAAAPAAGGGGGGAAAPAAAAAAPPPEEEEEEVAFGGGLFD